MSGLSGGLIEGKGKFVKRGVGKDSSSQKELDKKNYVVSFLLHQTKNKSVNQSNEMRQSMRRQLERRKNETHRRVD